jgi:sulfonate transport system substrate-binding protein
MREKKVVRRFAALALCIAAALLPFAGCEKKEEPKNGPALRVAYLATANYFTVLSRDAVLVEELAKAGARQEFIGPSSPLDAITLVGAGSADVTSTGTGRFIYLICQGGPWAAFALEKYSGDSQGIVAAPGSGIKELRDLYGKKIGISQRGATGDYIVTAAFAWAGLDVSRVEKVELADADYSAAFASGRIDALASYDQHYANALATPGARKIVDGTEYGSLNWSIHIASAAFAKEHPEILRAAYRALRKKAAQAGENPAIITDAYREAGANETQLGVMKNFDIPRILPMDSRAVADLNKQARQYRDYGFISGGPEDFAPYVLDFSDAD